MSPILISLVLLQSATRHTTQDRQARAFVQRFYDWYAPRAEGDMGEDPSNYALRKKGMEFAKTLRKALLADRDAQAHAKGDLVGLEFDPFLNSQDPAGRYRARDVSRHGKSEWVMVFRRSTEHKGDEVAVTAVVGKHGGTWQFENFIYPQADDLLAVLRRLALDRRHYKSGQSSK